MPKCQGFGCWGHGYVEAYFDEAGSKVFCSARKPFAVWAARRASWCLTICVKVCSSPISTIPPSIPPTAMCCRTTAWWLCRTGSETWIEKAKLKPASDTPRKRRLRGSASKAGRRPGLSGSLGTTPSRYPHPRHHQTPSVSHVRRREAVPTDTTDRAASLLPVRRADSLSRQLRRSRAGLLRLAAGLDRPRGPSLMGCSACAYPDPSNYQLLR